MRPENSTPLKDGAKSPKKREKKIERWNSLLERLRSFGEEHGHCNVPSKYPPDRPLGSWVTQCRVEHRRLLEGRPTTMTPERIHALLSLNFQWEIHKQLPWKKRFEQLAEFRSKQGHCDVPEKGKDRDIPPGLKQWVLHQRKAYKVFTRRTGDERQKITQERIDMLDAVGFVWQPHTKKGRAKGDFLQSEIDQWNSLFERLKAFKESHGHCNVPSKYPEDKRLGSWVTDCRTEHRYLWEGKKTTMTTERIHKLLSLGFQWEVQKHKCLKWDERLSQLAEYKARRGNCNVPERSKDDDIPPGLGGWVIYQRKAYKALKGPSGDGKHLTQERIDALDALGFVWQLRNRTCQRRQPN